MRHRILPLLAGSVLTGLGLVNLLNLQYFSILNLHLDVASCIFMAGLAFLIPEKYSRFQAVALSFLGVSIIIVSQVALFFHANQMPINTYLGLGLTGLAFILFPYKQSVSIVARLVSFCVLTLGLSALVGYILNLDFLYSWNRAEIMSLGVSIAFSILGIGLWAIFTEDFTEYRYQIMNSNDRDKKILTLHKGIFICVLSVVAISVFILMSMHNAIPSSTKVSFDQLQLPIRILLVLTLGIILLYWQFLPLLKNIFYSVDNLTETNRRLEESENRFRSAFDYAAIGMALLSPEGKCIKVNNSICNILGYDESELLNQHLDKIIHPEDSKKDAPNIKKMLEGEMDLYRSEQRYIHKDGHIVWIMVNLSIIRDAENKPLYFISQMQNVTNEKNAAEQLEQLAYYDSLTGLANRNKLEQFINALLISARRRPQGFAIVFLDLDHFKNINDTLGHDAGDLLLQVVADRLKSAVRKNDLVARLGGDEFVLVITEVEKLEAIANVAQKLLSNLLTPITIKSHENYITTSIGISFYPYDGQDLQTLMKNADLALYRAKEQGRNNYQFCTPEMTARAHEKMMRQNALAHALIKNEFQIYYLPIVDLTRNRISGVEALLRWQSQEYGKISPEEIIALADETGFIIPLGEWILNTACKQVKTWQKSGLTDLTLAVNVSARQFKQSNYVETLLNILNTIQFSPNQLELEITESLIMQDPEKTHRILELLKDSGIKIAIDDFGTGYSSLSYLKNFCIDKIKIDKTFIRQITTNETSSAIVMAMIVMSNKLGIKAMAEGVESQDQYEYLLREKCTEIQGYYVCEPLSSSAMTEFLQHPEMKLQMLQEIKEQVDRDSSSRSSA